MSDRLERATCALVLTGVLALPGLGYAAEATALDAARPVGELSAPAPVGLEPDPLFDEDYDEDIGAAIDFQEADPWEPANRKLFGFNQLLDVVLFDPVTAGYQLVVPEPGRRAVRRFFVNLNSPSVLVNELLQLRFKDAGETLGRFVLNTAVGWGGLFDPAQEVGWEKHEADFGQTLAMLGVESGPYLVLPLFGPSTVRDGLGDLVDRMFQPLTYLLGPTQQLLVGGGYGLSLLEENDAVLDALEESSLDFYAVLRSAYLQNRQAQLDGGSHLEPEPLPASELAVVH